MRTASFGGACPWFRNRRTFEYDAVSTSVEKVDSGACDTSCHALSVMRSYASVFQGGAPASPPAMPPMTPPTYARIAEGGGGNAGAGCGAGASFDTATFSAAAATRRESDTFAVAPASISIDARAGWNPASVAATA